MNTTASSDHEFTQSKSLKLLTGIQMTQNNQKNTFAETYPVPMLI